MSKTAFAWTEHGEMKSETISLMKMKTLNIIKTIPPAF